MDVKTWTTISRLLDDALDLPPGARGRWLDGLDRHYDALKPRLGELLAEAASMDREAFLATLPKFGAPLEGASLSGDPETGSRVGALVGPYRLVRPIASGGQGAVWLGERADGLLTRPVAVKLPQGLAFRPGLAERMAREREILATLTHPNIARLYDAGMTAEGEPFLALEYVEGSAIDQHANARLLTVVDRVRLFLQVVRAVAFAHGRLVIHRDLKPSNLMVTADGDVRLLDFGIAKLLGDEAVDSTLTVESGRAMTLAYASPEQVGQQPLGVATDVYSLGVVLFELLTGVRPYVPARESAAALEEAILADEPRRASEAATTSVVRRAVAGDLDTILAKALKKAPADRYRSAEAFADDLERYLAARPVLARPDSRVYRLRKFAVRHRLGVAATAASLVAVVAGAGVALWQAEVARVEQRRAEEVKTFIASIFAGADPYSGGSRSTTALDLLTKARARLDQIAPSEARSRVELMTIIGQSLLMLQDTDGAEAVVLQAVEEGRRALGPEHPLTLDARLLSVDVHRFRGRTGRMREELDALVPAFRRLGAPRQKDLATALEYRSHMALDDGRYPDAEAAAGEALRLGEATLGTEHPKTVQLAMMYAQTLQYGVPRPEQALAAAEHAMRLVSRVHADPAYPAVVDMRHIYARALGGAGRFASGIEELERAIRDASTRVGPDGRKVAFMRSNLARIQRRAGRLDDAIANHRASSAVLVKQFAPDSWSYLGGVVSEGQTYLVARRAAEAKAALEQSVAGLTRTMGAGHQQVTTATHNLWLARAWLGEHEAAEQALAALVAQYRPADVALLGPPLHSLGIVQRLNGHHAAAIEAQTRALERFGDGVATQLDRLHVETELGLNLLALGRFEDARGKLGRAVDGFAALQLAVTPQAADARLGVGRAYLGLDRPGDALEPLRFAAQFWRGRHAVAGAGEAARWLATGRAALAR
ncbi:MAG: serine/threonine protein kinase [Acidobacteria bacterium]|nr:serine/threonine protein kinase [Acidobacteriota bacterium]